MSTFSLVYPIEIYVAHGESRTDHRSWDNMGQLSNAPGLTLSLATWKWLRSFISLIRASLGRSGLKIISPSILPEKTESAKVVTMQKKRRSRSKTTKTRSIIELSNPCQIVVKSPVRRKISRFPRLLLEQHSSRSVQRLVKDSQWLLKL